MMAGWVVYTLLTSLLLLLAGYAMERIARAFRAPVRVVWVGVIMAAAALSLASVLRTPTTEPRLPLLAPAGVVVLHEVTPEPRALDAGDARTTTPRTRSSAETPLSELAMRLREMTALRLDPSRWQRYDTAIATMCVSLAVAGLAVLFASYVRLLRSCRALDEREIDGMPVLVSRQLGPAVFGVLRPRVVVPRWLLSLPPDERSTVLLHEAEHSAARDPMLVLVGAVAVALQPWNAMLWIAFARLRLAVEADCDARVLRLCRRDARWYGTLLLHICEHELTGNLAGRLPLTAFVDSTSHLERRVRRMTDRQPRVRSLSTMGALVGVVLCVGMAFSVRILSAHAATAKAGAKAGPIFEPAVSASSEGLTAAATVDSGLTLRSLQGLPFPMLASSQHEQPRFAMRVVLPASQARETRIATVPFDTLREVFSPETLLVRASNSLWPMRARIVSKTAGVMSYVTVTDTLGHVLPTADSLVVEGPVRLIMPRARFEVSVESLSGDMYFRTSLVPSPDGNGRWLGEMLGRSFIASRDVVDGSVELRLNGAGVVHGQRVQ